MAKQEKDNVHASPDPENIAVMPDTPKNPKDVERNKREIEQHDFARQQVKANKMLIWFNGLLVFATFCTIGTGIWQGIGTQSAANTASQALYVTERAYVGFAYSPNIDFEHSEITLVFQNVGHLPSGQGRAVIHGMTITCHENVTNCPMNKMDVIHWWREQKVDTITSTNPAKVIIQIPQLTAPLLRNGSQTVVLMGHVSYGDGFKDDFGQRSPFCIQTLYETALKDAVLTSCKTMGPESGMEQLDGYPNASKY